MQYDHVGIPTTQQHEHEVWIEASRVWVTDAHKNPWGSSGCGTNRIVR